MATSGARALSPDVLTKIELLKLETQRIVEGIYSGLHKSPHHGASIEFNEHKEYVPGDDIRRIDWRVFAKSDRYYIKRYEQETNLKSMLFVDASASMEYRSQTLSKLDYAARMALAFSYILLNQSDGVGLLARSDTERIFIPPSTQTIHVNTIARALGTLKGSGETRIHEWLEETLDSAGKTALLIVFSDFFCDEEALRKTLRTLSVYHKEILVFHLLDPNELEFPFSLRTRFLDMESPRDVTLEPLSVKADYLRLLHAFTDSLRSTCHRYGISYHLCDTSLPVERHLFDFFGKREGA